MAVPDTQEWRDFFETYKNLSVLWKPNKKKNKVNRYEAWKLLLQKYIVLDKNANSDSLKRRISNIRSCYRRELNRVEKSKEIAATDKDIHRPSLWYYDLLNFLSDDTSLNSNLCSATNTDEFTNAYSEILPQASSQKTNVKAYKKQTIECVQELIIPNTNLDYADRPNTFKTDAHIYADCWAHTFSKLNDLQKIYAKQAIDEILVRGQLEQLTQNYLSHMPMLHVPNVLYTPHTTAALPIALTQAQNSVFDTSQKLSLTNQISFYHAEKTEIEN